MGTARLKNTSMCACEVSFSELVRCLCDVVLYLLLLKVLMMTFYSERTVLSKILSIIGTVTVPCGRLCW